LTVAATTDLVPINPNPNVLEAEAGEIVISGAAARLVLGLGPSATAKLKTDLDDPAPRGENYFVLFRAAQRSESAVERFLLFYALLLLIVVRGPDEQRVVDAFIRREEPLVPETRRPDKPQIKETIYSRLRNEIGHKRQNANIAQTRAEIEGRVDSLARLVQRAIATLA
jgi:hypothetical protein